MKKLFRGLLLLILLNNIVLVSLPMISCVSGNTGKPSTTIDPDLQVELEYWKDQALTILREWISNITIEDIVNSVLRIIDTTKISASRINTGSTITSASIRQAVDIYIKSLSIILPNEDIDIITRAVESYLIAHGSTTRYGYTTTD